MKKLVLILVLFFTLHQSYSYSWESYGPEGIKANNLFFFWQDYEPLLIFSDSGMFMKTNSWLKSWEYFDYPAKDAAQLNNNTILFVAGDGSYSDGIYSLNLQTYQIEVVDYCINPAFINYDDQTGVYYVGFENGLFKSGNGLSWESVSFFDGKNCVGMEFYYDHLVVNVSATSTHLYLSDDSGATWINASYCPGWVQCMAFREDGKLYAVVPDHWLYSSGLWSSDDFGDNWEVEFYLVDMKTVCTAEGESFVLIGWESPGWVYEGIAIYDPDVPPPGLTFLNEGLPNKNINKISYRLQLCSGAVLYVCTDEGVYACWDYFVGIDEHPDQHGSIIIYPNPVTDQTTIKVNISKQIYRDNSIMVLNNRGQKADEIKFENNFSNEFEIKWDKGNLPAGVYYFLIKTEKEKLTEKFVIL